MRIKKVTVGKNHWYVDQDDGDRRIPGVTSITKNGMPAPQLMNWTADATAEYALDNWEYLSSLAPSERLRLMKKGRYETRDSAADKGREVHKLAEKLANNESVGIPVGLEGYVRACVQFLDDFDFRPRHTEAVVYNETRRYCGQLDAEGDLLLPDIEQFADVDRGEESRSDAIIDWKTSRSGIFGETAYQLTGYRWCEWMLEPDGEVIPMPQVDLAMGVHLTPLGYSVKIAKTDEAAFKDFLYIKENARINDKTEKDAMLDAAFTLMPMRTYKLTPVEES